MKRRMIPLCAVMGLVLASCVSGGDPQLETMPAGPLLSYRYVQVRTAGNDTLCYAEVWRPDSMEGRGGLLRFKNSDVTQLDAMPQPIVVSEADFDSLYRLTEENKLYRLAAEYTTAWKGDAYAYVPWTLVISFPEARILTNSDGSTPIGYDYTQYLSGYQYLEHLFQRVGYQWLSQQPVTLDGTEVFNSLNLSLKASDEETAEGVYVLYAMPDDSLLTTYTLVSDGTNCYCDKSAGLRFELHRVQEEVMMVCYDVSGIPQWAMSAHRAHYAEGHFDEMLSRVIQGNYVDNSGRKVSISSGKISGFQGKEEQRCVIYDYHGQPAERLHLGDYPNEEDYAFCRSQSGLNIYATEYEHKDEYDWDSRPTTPIDCLHRQGEQDWSWLNNQALDSYFLRYYDAAQREQMQRQLEQTTDSTDYTKWNLWLLRHFADAAPFKAEADFK